MKLIFQNLVLIISFVLIFVWQKANLYDYTVPFLGALIALYLIVSVTRKNSKGFLSSGKEGSFGIFVLNTLIFLLIFSTDSINSPLFFLIYFLAFSIAFVFEPMVIVVFILGAVLIFLPDALRSNVTFNLIKLGSILLISPLAYFFSLEYRKNQAQQEEVEALKERTKDAADTISKDLEDVIKDEKENLKQKDMDKLNDVLEQTEDLREESKQQT